jgi:uncharacterized membrane protein
MKFRWILAAACLIVILIGIVKFPSLPHVMEVHWDINGNPDGYGSKWTNLLAIPFILTSVWVALELSLCYVKNEAKQSVIRSYGWIGIGFGVFMVLLQWKLLNQSVVQQSTHGGTTTSFKVFFPAMISLGTDSQTCIGALDLEWSCWHDFKLFRGSILAAVAWFHCG